jgi:PilZ domain
MVWSDHLNALDSIAGDRRSDRRYRIELDLRWKLIRRRKVRDAGTGRTLDLSSGGILFDATRPLPVGMNVELSIAWPVLLHNVAPMQLAITGRIIRTNGSQIAIHMDQHEFRTLGVPAEHREVLAAASRTPGILRNAALTAFDKVREA